MTETVPPEVNNDLFHFGDIKGPIVCVAPIHKLFHLLLVSQLLAMQADTNNHCVMCTLYDVVCVQLGTTVVGLQGKRQWTQDAALRGNGAQ